MYKVVYYCTKCNKYGSLRAKSRHRECDGRRIILLEPTKNIVNRLEFLGFKVDVTWLDMIYGELVNHTLNIDFTRVYSEYLLDELPNGWSWGFNKFTNNSRLCYTTGDDRFYNIERATAELDRAIAELEEYLEARNAEGIATAMLLMYD